MLRKRKDTHTTMVPITFGGGGGGNRRGGRGGASSRPGHHPKVPYRSPRASGRTAGRCWGTSSTPPSERGAPGSGLGGAGRGVAVGRKRDAAGDSTWYGCGCGDSLSSP